MRSRLLQNRPKGGGRTQHEACGCAPHPTSHAPRPTPHMLPFTSKHACLPQRLGQRIRRIAFQVSRQNPPAAGQTGGSGPKTARRATFIGFPENQLAQFARAHAVHPSACSAAYGFGAFLPEESLTTAPVLSNTYFTPLIFFFVFLTSFSLLFT